MLRSRARLIGALLTLVPVAAADEPGHRTPIVVDCDMGLDDAVTLAMALQSPHVDIGAIVASEGAAGGKTCVEHLERMLDLFNRKEIPLYAGARTDRRMPPPFRAVAEEAVDRALPGQTPPFHRPFLPEAYLTPDKKAVVLALGPLTNLATALQSKPEIKNHIKEVILPGTPDPGRNWNIGYDREAFSILQESRIPLIFIVPDPGGRKPEEWGRGNLAVGQGTSIGEGFFHRLLGDPDVRGHYVTRLPFFHDELAFLYLTDASLFSESGTTRTWSALNGQPIVRLFNRSLCSGRQHKDRVVFKSLAFPETMLQSDVKERMTCIIALNGEYEWFAQLLVSELHDHLGVYSVLGAKMGLRAAEMLNAPQHGMKIVSHTASDPPISCLNDGVIVATGSTPGRGLFTHVAGPAGSSAVTFGFNGRAITLALKDEYAGKIGIGMREITDAFPLESEGYWTRVRRLGLEIWETWHRRDVFEVVAAPTP